MTKRELKYNLKSFLIWTIIVSALFLVVFLVYPSISNSENIKMMDEMMKMFPEDLLKAFNMDIATIDTAYGWLKSEGFIMILLITGCYSSILGSNILLKEENDNTIEYLNSLPIKRTNIVLSKALVGTIYIISLIFIIGIFNYIGLSISGDFNQKQYLLLSLTPIFPSLVIYFICLFISTFTNKTKKMLGISLGFVLISYIIQAFSTIAEEVEYLKYISPFTLADLRNVMTSISINPIMIILTIIISILFLILTIIKYNKKELV